MDGNDGSGVLEFPADALIFVASDILGEIVEGRTDIVDGLLAGATRANVKLLKSCICEALASTTAPTASGLHALGRLLAMAELPDSHDWSLDTEDPEYRLLHADLFLAALIDREEVPAIAALLQQWRSEGAIPIVKAAELVVALLSVKEGDPLSALKFAYVLALTEVERADASTEERAAWSVNNGDRDELRRRVMEATTAERTHAEFDSN